MTHVNPSALLFVCSLLFTFVTPQDFQNLFIENIITPTNDFPYPDGLASMAFFVDGDLIYFFGGYNDDNYYNDMCDIPPLMSGARFVRLDSDTNNNNNNNIPNRIFLVAGFDTTESVNTTYEFNIETSTWTLLPVTGHYEKRSWPCVVSYNQFIYSFFGYFETADTSSVFVLDSESLVWEEINTPGDIPPPRDACTCVRRGSMVYFFGGVYYEDQALKDTYNDFFVFNLDTRSWQLDISISGNVPRKRGYHHSYLMGDWWFNFAGEQFASSGEFINLNDLFIFDFGKMKWQDTTIIGTRDSGRTDAIFSSIDNETIYVIAGFNTIKPLADLRTLSPICREGYHGTKECYECEKGTFSSIGSPTCSPCSPGSFSNSTGASACQLCQVQSYTSVYGSSSCISCPSFSTTLALGTANLSSCLCLPGYFGDVGKDCTICPEGGVCKYFGTITPAISPGYYRESGKFTKCTPMSACLGGDDNNCAYGYLGFLCAKCDDGFYRLGDSCKSCPGGAKFIIIAVVVIPFMVIFLCVWSIKYWKYSRNSTFFITIEFIQVLALFAGLRSNLPGFITNFLNSVSIFNFNVDLFAPECSLGFDYWDKVVFLLLLPAVIIIPFVGSCWLAKVFEKRFPHNIRPKLSGYFDMSVNSSLLILTIVYVYISNKAVEPFLCTKQIDGKFHLDANPSLICYDDEWYYYLPFLIVCLILYAILFPVGSFYFVYKHKKRKEETILWERYSSLFAPFKDSYYWWMIVLKLRKLSLVLVQLGGNKVLSIAISFLLVSLGMFGHSYVNPYYVYKCNYLEQTTLLVWLFFLFCMVVWGQSTISSPTNNALGVLVIIICSLTALLCLFFILYDLRSFGSKIFPLLFKPPKKAFSPSSFDNDSLDNNNQMHRISSIVSTATFLTVSPSTNNFDDDNNSTSSKADNTNSTSELL